MKYYLYLFYCIFFILFVSCSSAKKPESDLLVFDPTKVDLHEMKLSEIADEITYIQPDSTFLILGYKTVLFTENSLYLLDGKSGEILKYDWTGKFQTKIGSVGQGPGEYSSQSFLIGGEVTDRIFVKDYPDRLFSYDLDGRFIEKIEIEGKPEKNIFEDIFHFNNYFYQFNYINPHDECPYMWSVANLRGEFLSSRQDLSFNTMPPFPSNKIWVFSLTTASFNGESLLYWNEYNDTIFKITTDCIKPFCLWAESDFRMTTAKVRNEDFTFYIPKNVLDLYNYILFYMEKAFHKPFFFFYHKDTGIFTGTEGPLVDDINGGPAVRSILDSFRLNGREYLRTTVEPYDLKDALLASDTPKSRQLAETIDEEGNPVVVLVRLKNNQDMCQYE